MTAREKYMADLLAAYKEVRGMLIESRKSVEETTRLLEHLNAQKLDYPRCARVNYSESGDEIPDFPLAKFVRLIEAKREGS